MPESHQVLSTFLQQVVNGLTLGSIYALIALGYTMVYGVLRLINFAHGDVFMVGCYIAFYVASAMLRAHIVSWYAGALAFTAATLGCGILGVIIERLAYKPVRHAPKLTPLITAIGVSLLIENVAVLKGVFGPAPQFCPQVLPSDKKVLQFHGVSEPVDSVLLILFTVALLLILWYIVTYTKVGKAMRAVSQDKDAASMMGININNIISFTFFLGSALAGSAGFLFAALTHVQINAYLGIPLGLKAFTAAVLGGIGNIPGAALGGLIMGLAEAMVEGYGSLIHIPPSYSDAVSFVILIVILLVRPSGLLGKSGVEKV
jgi:branched-chain amino acid transport system permease protein